MTAQNQRRSDIHYIDPLCRLGRILAVIPPYNILNDHKERKSLVFYKTYVVLVLLIIIIGSGGAIYGRFIDSYVTFPASTLIVTDLSVAISLTVTNIFAILAPSLWHLKDFEIFFETFKKADECVTKDPKVKAKKCKAFYIEMFVGHFAILILFGYDAYVWISGQGFSRYRHYMFRDFQNYHLYITVLTMYNFALSMKYRFEAINNTMTIVGDLPACKNPDAMQLEVNMEKMETCQVIREISQKYETLIKQISLFNTIFGWQILFMTLCTMLGLLNSLDLLTVFITTKGYHKVTGENMGYELIILSSLWALWQLALGIIVTVACNQAQKEAQQTADVCFSMLLKLPPVSDCPQKKALREELLLLSTLAIERCPSFSAAGFFTIDYSLLLALLGSLTSYVIVLIQFK